jgi:hypothetical protein
MFCFWLKPIDIFFKIHGLMAVAINLDLQAMTIDEPINYKRSEGRGNLFGPEGRSNQMAINNKWD